VKGPEIASFSVLKHLIKKFKLVKVKI